MLYAKYPQYKKTNLEWLGDIPSDWEYGGLTKYLDNIVDYRGKTPEKVEEGVFLVTAKNIKNGNIDYSLSQEFVKLEEYEEIMRRGLPEIGDVLFTTEAPLGEVANVDRINIALAQRIIKFRGVENVLDNYYLKYWIQSHTFQSNLKTFATGSTAAGIKASKLSSLQVLLPSYSEQKQIVLFLDSKVNQIDDLIIQKEQIICLLEEKRQSMIAEAVTKGLNPNIKMQDSGVEWIGQIPDNYKVIKLKHLVETKITDGPHETPVLYEEGVPFISAEAIKSGKVDFDYMRGFISKEDHEKFSKKCSPINGDIFMVKSGATTGKIGIVDTNEEFSIWSPLALIRANKEKIINKFLYYYMQCDIFQKQVQLGWNYGTQQNIGMGVIENLFVICPPIDVQSILLEKIEAVSKNVEDLKEELDWQIQKLKDYRQSLIYEAVTGKIDIRNYELEEQRG